MKKWLSELPKKLADHLVIRGLGILVIAGLVGLYFVVRDSEDVAVPPAALVAGGGLLLLMMIISGALWRRARKFETYHSIHIAYTNVLNQALETLRRRAAPDRREVNVDEIIEKGILHPFRDLLQAIARSDVRLSILVLDEQRHWKMALQAGHSLDSQRAFDLEYARSFSRFAFESGDIEYSNDLSSDPRFEQHPEARPGRDYSSIVSLPIIANGKSVAVFNVIATRQDAFATGDFFYIGLTGSIIDIAWSLREQPSGSDGRDAYS